MKKIAVILSGCGHQDGSEIHEATLTLWAIHKNGADFVCFAPDMEQRDVIDHRNGQPLPETRNVLVESARIARGNIRPLTEFVADDFDGLIIPGGFGAAKNLCDFAEKGADMTVLSDVERAVLAIYRAQKPLGALCIAPVILARLLPEVVLTTGQPGGAAATIENMGARHENTQAGQISVDKKHRVVSTPCYMLDSRIDEIAEGIDTLVRTLLSL